MLLTTFVPSGRRLRGIAAAALAGAAALSVTAGASRAEAAVTIGDSIEAFIGSNMVGVTGYPAGTDVWVERNGVVIAQAVDVIGASGGTVLNHDDCFDDVTPDILAGDVIMAAPNVGDAGDSMTVADVFLDQNIAAPIGNDVTISGAVGQAGSYAFQFRFGAADRHNATLSLPAGAFTRTLTLTPAQAADWPFAEATLEWSNGGTELTISDGEGGAGPGCPPLAQSSALASDTLLGAGEDLVLSGVAAAGITPSVAINGGAAAPVTPAGGSWSRTVPASQLAEGANEVVVTFAGAGAPGPRTFAVTKDTVAPAAAPSASPPGGTYTEAQSVTLNGVEAGQAYYTTDGSDPTKASTHYAGPIAITASQTLKVVQYDAAGNRGPVASHAYVITAPAPQPRQQAPAAPQPIVRFVPAPVVASVNASSAGALRVRGSRSLRTLRRKGLRYSVNASSSTRYLLVRLSRITRSGGRTKRALVQERVVRLRSGGSYTGTLKIGKRLKAGRYELAVAAAGADEEYSGFVRTALRLTR